MLFLIIKYIYNIRSLYTQRKTSTNVYLHKCMQNTLHFGNIIIFLRMVIQKINIYT